MRNCAPTCCSLFPTVRLVVVVYTQPCAYLLSIRNRAQTFCSLLETVRLLAVDATVRLFAVVYIRNLAPTCCSELISLSLYPRWRNKIYLFIYIIYRQVCAYFL